jgi:hypothetical protein
VTTDTRHTAMLDNVGVDINAVVEAAVRRSGMPPIAQNVLGPVPGVDVMVKRPQGLLNVGTLSARMAVLRSCALDI